jgi:hypothetical protein
MDIYRMTKRKELEVPTIAEKVEAVLKESRSAFRFFVAGKPEPQGSMKAVPMGGARGGRPMMKFSNEKTLVPYRRDVAKAAAKAWSAFLWQEGIRDWRNGLPVCTSAVVLAAEFRIQRPKSHYVANDRNRELKSKAPEICLARMDVDKLQRSVGDALTNVVYDDDSRIMGWVWPHKCWAVSEADVGTWIELFVYGEMEIAAKAG